MNGAKTLLNPTTKEAYPCPVFDQDDFLWVAYRLNVSATANHFDDKPNFDFLVVDEGADSPKISIERAKQLYPQQPNLVASDASWNNVIALTSTCFRLRRYARAQLPHINWAMSGRQTCECYVTSGLCNC